MISPLRKSHLINSFSSLKSPVAKKLSTEEPHEPLQYFKIIEVSVYVVSVIAIW